MSTIPYEEKTFRSLLSVEQYAARRYQTRLQRIVDRREQQTLKRLLERHVGHGRLEVLDAPCGYGRLAPLLNSLGYQLRWADLSPFAVEYVLSRQPAAARHSGIVANITDLPLEDRSVDMVTTIRLLQHFPQKARRLDALREIARVTRRWALVSFYDVRSLHSLTKGLGRALQGRPLRTWMLTRCEFAEEAKQSGFVVRAFAAWARGLHAHTLALLEKP
jgi:SAM-dependent methyltransferase